MVNPLRLSPDRFALWSSALILVGLVEIVAARFRGLSDWLPFVDAGRHVGTQLLLHPAQQIDTWAYPPAAAYLFVPFARLPAPWDFAVYEVVLLACAVAGGLVAAKIFSLVRSTAVVMVLAWGSVSSAALVIGQTSPFGFMLAMLAILGLQRDSVPLTALSIGLLLYKPTYALPLILVLLARGKLRELAIVAAIGSVWYVTSVAAADGDWVWPLAYIKQLQMYQLRDFDENAVKALGIPTLLTRLGAGNAVLAAVVLAGAAAATIVFRRVGAVEAGCAA